MVITSTDIGSKYKCNVYNTIQIAKFIISYTGKRYVSICKLIVNSGNLKLTI